MQNITHKFILKHQINGDGTRSIIFRVTVDRKSIYIFTGVRIHEKNFDSKKLAKGFKSAEDFNIILYPYREKLFSFISESAHNKTKILPEDVKKLYDDKTNAEPIDFYSYCDKILNTEGKTLRSSTMKLHKQRIKQLKEYTPVLTFDRIDRSWLVNYENHLKFVVKNDTNTIHAKMRFIRTYINKAIRDGIIKDYVFKQYRLKTKPTKKRFLPLDELKELEDLYLKTTSFHVKKTLQYFLFGCYTALRYGDLKKICWDDIKNDTICMTTEKTGIITNIPLNNRIRSVLPERKNDKVLIFDVPTNQVGNRSLKDIQEIAKVKTKLSFHVARHTFATIALNKGMSMSALSRLMGHTTSGSTEVYTKITDTKLIEEMKIWDNI